jgi:DNA-binding LytR/AlgR family response regulator
MIRCVVIDDEPLARQGMLEYIGLAEGLEVVGVFETAHEAGPAIERLCVDLIFLDIEMPGMSGVELMRSLKTKALVIFTTAYPEFALEGYELDAVDYLLKPILPRRFLRAINKAKEILSWRAEEKIGDADYLFVKESGRYTKVFFDDILYAEARQNYVALQLKKEKFIVYITLSLLERQLPASTFMRIHKSYIVSLNGISGIDKNEVIVGPARLPVSRNMKDQLMKKLLDNKLLKR